MKIALQSQLVCNILPPQQVGIDTKPTTSKISLSRLTTIGDLYTYQC